ncbi:MAG: hypothetical protein H6618_06715 [Deltaproteobacteria bacterium]|nr:hypothetical protein [Deltaproteobacteria bacterium]
MKQRLIVFELNEFNRELLMKAVSNMNLPHLKGILDLPQQMTMTDDTYESDCLEPWVQWVNVHTGKTSSEHGIRHLGDVTKLKHKQIWETLSDEGVTSGIWGVLNGNLGHAPLCRFFFPDPWTFSEEATPQHLNHILEFPRYLATNRIRPSLPKLFLKFLNFSRVLSVPFVFTRFIRHLPRAFMMIARYPRSEFSGFCFFEYLSAMVFCHQWKKHKPEFSILFVNMLAHLQHYHWKNLDISGNKKIHYGLFFIDKIIGELRNMMGENDKILVTNALSQKNTLEEDPWISYRPRDHERFLKDAGIDFHHVEALMSYDANIEFTSGEARDLAESILSEASLNGRKLFLTDRYPDAPMRLFYRFQFTDPVNPESLFKVNGRTFMFDHYFATIAERTGKHIQTGTAYSNTFVSSKVKMNHDLFGHILSFFRSQKDHNIKLEKTG